MQSLGIFKVPRSLLFPRVRSMWREFLWVGLGQATAASGALVGVRLLTHALPPAAYGELMLGMTAAILVHQVLLGPTAMASLRFFSPARESNQLQSYLQVVRGLIVQATIILLVAVCVLSLGLWITRNARWLGLLSGATLFALFSGYSATLDGIQNAARQRTTVAWHDGLTPWVRFSAAVVLISALGASGRAAMFGYALASALVLGSQCFFFQRMLSTLSMSNTIPSPEEIRLWMKRLRNYAWPFAAWGLFTWAQIASDRWALQTFRTTADVGLYAVLYQLGYYPIVLVSGLVTQFTVPVLFGIAGDGSTMIRMIKVRRLNSELVLGAAVLTVLATSAALVVHGQIFSLLVAPDYRGISWLMPWMVLSGGAFASGQIAAQLLLSGLATEKLIIPKIATATGGISIHFIGAYLFGLRGVVWASAAFSVAYFLWMLHLSNRLFESSQRVDTSFSTIAVSQDLKMGRDQGS